MFICALAGVCLHDEQGKGAEVIRSGVEESESCVCSLWESWRRSAVVAGGAVAALGGGVDKR